MAADTVRARQSNEPAQPTRRARPGTAAATDDVVAVARLERVIARTIEALGDRKKALHWLVTPNRALAGSRPVAMLGADDGASAVEAVLGRIKHGDFG